MRAIAALDAPPAEVCLVVSRPEPTPFGRIASAFAAGFRALNEHLDVVLVEGDQGSEFDGLVRRTGLGTRARGALCPLASYMRRAKPKVVFVTPSTLAPPTLLAGRLTATPVVPWEVTFVERDVEDPRAPLRARLLPPTQRLTYRWAAAVAAVSADVAAHVARTQPGLANHAVFELPNPIDPAALREQRHTERPAAGAAPRGFSICAGGRLTRQKGFDLLIAALARRRAELPDDWRLTLLGEGDLRAQLEEQARAAGLDHRIEFAGLLPNPFPAMSGSDVFVHPARWEGFGMVLLEALALGVPVLATNCPGGPREILDCGRYGRLVPPEDPAALGEALVALCRDEGERRRLSDAGPRRAVAYSAPRVAERMLSLARACGKEGES